MDDVNPINDPRPDQDENGNSRQPSSELSPIEELEGHRPKPLVSAVSNEKDTSPPVGEDAPISIKEESRSEKLRRLRDETKNAYERLDRALELEEHGRASARS
jgi:hypothetical protein